MTKTGYTVINNARLYNELAGGDAPFVMIHAGIADCRMWDNEFQSFADSHLVLRFDMRGYGKSLPVDSEFNIQDDFLALTTALDINEPMILMGCSIGAGLAIDFALTYPQRVGTLILVGGAPTGFESDVEGPDALFAESEAAFLAGEFDRVAEIDMKIWFDGLGRAGDAANQQARRKAYHMARLVTKHESKNIGRHVRKEFDKPAVQRLAELKMPTLVVIGENDLPFLRSAADDMTERIPGASKAVIANAAHLPNMEHPETFRVIIEDFLASG